MDPQELKDRLSSAVFAFRGYNVTNLGRTGELLKHPRYGPIVRDRLRDASRVCAEVSGRRIDLARRARRGRNTTLKTYDEAIALIMAVEKAHHQILAELFGIEMTAAKFSMGYSLGEVAAVALSGVMRLEEAMTVPLAMAKDSAELAKDVTLGVLFSRGRELPLDLVHKLCLEINQIGEGVIGISAHLAPNSLLLMGQGKTIDRFKARLGEFPKHANLRKNAHRFPPMHTPIVWQRNIPNRAAVLMQTIKGGLSAPQPPVLSLVTGKCSYNDHNARDMLEKWTDHPQLLWDAVYETLRSGIDLVIHVGPEPNIMPATYRRLQENVETETKGKLGMRALTAVVHHPWIKMLLPERTALLRAPQVKQLILEDWLLEQDPA